MRPRLMLYLPSLGPGGAERVMALLASGFADRGCDVLLVTDDTKAAENRPYLDARVRRVALGQGHLRSVARLIRLLRAEHPDAVLGALGGANAKLAVAAWLTGRLHRAAFSYHGFAESEPRPLAQTGFRLAPWLARHGRAVIAVSQPLAARLAPGRPVAVIPNPVAIDRIAPPPADLRQRPPHILAMGRLVAGKDFPTLIRAFAAMTTPGRRLTILGDGEERAALHALIRDLGLEGTVSLPGYRADPFGALAEARVFALSSRSEAFGNVIIEALAAGLPVVATDAPGPQALLQGSPHGALVPMGDHAAMARALDQALAEPGDPMARRRFAEEFSVDRQVARYAEVLGVRLP